MLLPLTMKRKTNRIVHDLTVARCDRYYATAREYAALQASIWLALLFRSLHQSWQGLTIRGPARLLDSSKANLALLYAGNQGLAAQYARRVYDGVPIIVQPRLVLAFL